MADAIKPSLMFSIGSVLPALSIIMVCSRFYIRITYKQGLGVDDWLIIPALLTLFGSGIVVIMGEERWVRGYTISYMSFDIGSSGQVYISKLLYAFSILNILNLTFVKISILFFYRRVFVTGHNRRLDIFTKIFAGVVIIWGLADLFVTMFFCGTNFQFNWKSSLADYIAYCGNAEAVNLAFFTLDLLLDLILFTIPIPLITRLRLSKTRRFGAVFVFVIGGLAIIGSIVRLIVFIFAYTVYIYAFTGSDQQFTIAMFFYWSIFEGGFAVIVACLPTLQLWFTKTSIERFVEYAFRIFSTQLKSRSQQRPQDQSGSMEDAYGSGINLHDKASVDV